MSIFKSYREKHGNIEGWFDIEAQAIWDCLLCWQQAAQVRGNMLEIGVYKGKSATLSTLHATAQEHCLYVDPILNETTNTLLQSCHAGEENRTHFIKSFSEAITTPQFLSQWHKSFRWIHIDGEHTGMALANDLKVADALLHRNGIVCLDDFLSPRYPQITQSVFTYLAKDPTSFALVLCGFNKGYLCRPYLAPFLRKYIQEKLQIDLQDRTQDQFTLWHSTLPDDLNCFGITPRENATPYRGPDWMPDKVIY
jgi:predicted O-methyltransferase YrrM